MPDWSFHVRPRLASLRLSPAREAEIVEEMSLHLDEHYEELRSAGASDGDARDQALAELLEPGALAHFMRPLRQANLPQPIALGEPRRFLAGDLWQDLRYAARMLGKQPGFAVAAVFTLALGIGANSAIFALVNATLLRALPYPHPEQLVMVWDHSPASSRGVVGSRNLTEWNRRNRSFSAIAGFRPNVGAMVMSGEGGMSENVPRQWVTAAMFDVLGVRPLVGRTFRSSDDVARARVVVLSEAYWRSRFRADPGVVGRSLRLDGEPWTIVGVLPNEAQLIGRTSIWAMMWLQGGSNSVAVGRLKPGVTMETAGAEMAALAEGLAREFPNFNTGHGVMLEPMREWAIGAELRQTSILFLGVVGFVLLICCASVANLLLTRAVARKRELAIRAALGADRQRVIRQLLTESVVISAFGGVFGLVVGAVILRVAPAVIPPGLLPPAVTLTFDAPVIAFCALTALLVGLLFGLVPAWHATRLSPAHTIGSNSRTVAGGGRVRGVIVAGQVATAVVLLFGAGLLLRTLLALQGVDRGYRAQSVLTMIVDPGPGYPTGASLRQFYDAATRELMAAPGVKGVAWATTLPMGRSYEGVSFFEVVGGAPVDESRRPSADYQIISPSYLTTLDLPVVAGRGFDDRDGPSQAPVCVVNEALVRRYLPDRSPIGQKLTIRRGPTAQSPVVVREIVGVARQVKGRPNERRT
jgi:putative ABC transport system permease protein